MADRVLVAHGDERDGMIKKVHNITRDVSISTHLQVYRSRSKDIDTERYGLPLK